MLRIFTAVLFTILVTACGRQSIVINGNNITFLLKNSEKTYFHSSIDGYIPHEMEFKNGKYSYSIDIGTNNEIKYFYKDLNGIIKLDCDLREMDDYGQYNCIFEM